MIDLITTKLLPQSVILKLLLLLLLHFFHCVDATYSGLGTLDGYDNINGERPICWTSKKVTSETEQQMVSIQPACPEGVDMNLHIPYKESVENMHLRTNQNYTFQLIAQIDLYSIIDAFGLSRESTFDDTVEAKVSFCPVSGIFCTPFIEEIAATTAEAAADDEVLRRLHKKNDNVSNTPLSIDLSSHQDDIIEGGNLRGNSVIDNTPIDNHMPDNTTTTTTNTTPGEMLDLISFSSSPTFVSLHEQPNQTHLLLYLNFTVNFNVPEIILPLGSIRLFIQNGTEGSNTLQLDIANIIHTESRRRSIVFQRPPDIRSVHPLVEIISYIIIGLSNLIQLVFLGMTIRYRKESVMTLSQGSFMILLQIASIVATTSSFFYLPKYDTFCLLAHPLTLIPFQFMLAIIISRLWRAISLLENVMNWSQSSSTRSTKNIRNPLRTLNRRNSHDTLASTSSSVISSDNTKLRHALSGINRMRTKFTIKWLWILIAAITFPQVIAQIFALLWYPPHLEISLNVEQSIGRYECGTDYDQWVHLTTTSITVITLFIAIYVSQRSNSLPAMFNEATSVSSALVVSLFVTVFAYAMRVISDTPTSSPDVSYMMMVIIVNNFSLNVSIRLVLPKLKLIWKGEKVVVSKLVTDHRMKEREKEEKRNLTVEFVERANQAIAESSDEFRCEEQHSRRLSNVTPGRRFRRTSSLESHSDPSQTVALDESDYTTILGRSLKRAESEGLMELSEILNYDDDQYVSNTIDSMLDQPSSQRRGDRRAKGTPLVICESDGPPNDLLVKILALKHRIGRINNRIFSGLIVGEGEWESLRAELRSTSKLMRNVQYKKG